MVDSKYKSKIDAHMNKILRVYDQMKKCSRQKCKQEQVLMEAAMKPLQERNMKMFHDVERNIITTNKWLSAVKKSNEQIRKSQEHIALLQCEQHVCREKAKQYAHAIIALIKLHCKQTGELCGDIKQIQNILKSKVDVDVLKLHELLNKAMTFRKV